MELPTEQMLMHQVHEALDEVAALDWCNITQDAIASAIAKRLKENLDIYCYSGKPTRRPEGCDGPEFLFDFSARLIREARLRVLGSGFGCWRDRMGPKRDGR